MENLHGEIRSMLEAGVVEFQQRIKAQCGIYGGSGGGGIETFGNSGKKGWASEEATSDERTDDDEIDDGSVNETLRRQAARNVRELRQLGRSSAIPPTHLGKAVSAVWRELYTRVLSYVDAVFLPLRLEFKKAAKSKTGEELDVREELIKMYWKMIVTPLLPKFNELAEWFEQGCGDCFAEAVLIRETQQMFTILTMSSNGDQRKTMYEMAKRFAKLAQP
ncbi:hypothetical protein EV182_007101 [Spiromyces aspiralis]|uniref:Uncharacterized protein n=1 Tax=Spiromyces aspiralis TaxID=68401 RepID=A0ACC1HEV1_9FUNG|nr:hypothetical protein EV182_007101 [Spiromyces aspiralis]